MVDYDPHAWKSSLFAIRGSMLREIFARVSLVLFWTALVIASRGHIENIAVPPTMHSLIGLALGLLLVFRTNASYDRFWEGRRMWGGMVNESRNLGRLVVVHLGSDPLLARAVLRWTAAFAYASMQALRNAHPLLGESAQALPDAEVKQVLAAKHVPLAVALRLSARLKDGRDRGLTSDIVYVAMDHNVQQIIDYLGACERIHKTPLPFAYMVHLRRSLLLYAYTLPLALMHDFGWWTLPAVFIVTFTLFGIEEIGVEIEDPFGNDDNDLPLERLCDTIDKSMLQLEADLPKPA